VNTTFHGLPAETTVLNWYRKTPPGFKFALKFPREVTHDLQLDWPAAEGLTNELIRLARALQDKCGPLLLQLPASFDRSAFNRRALATFLNALPTEELRLAVELRNAAWADEAIERAFAERNIAWCVVEGYTPNARSLLFPADFVYARWNRSGLQFNGYAEIQYDRSDALDWWAGVLTSLPPRVKTVYGYMADEFAGHAPTSLRMLCDRLGRASVDPKSQWPQPALL
jgi:uncharacterized protein YecE (DUF72 family)